jgi:L-lactate dehydrogenase complex protein LldE
MKVSLFVTCLVDQMWTSIGVSSVEVLRRVGCEVEFDKRRLAARSRLSTPAISTKRASGPALHQHFRREQSRRDRQSFGIVHGDGPSLPQLFAGDSEWLPRAHAIASKTHELSSFLVRVLKKEDVGASWNGRLTWHDACHGLRDLNIKSGAANVDSQRAWC